MRIWLSDLRGKKSQREIAAQCGITQQAYSYIETGERPPSVKVAKALGKALSFNWTKFYEEAEEEQGTQQKKEFTPTLAK